LADDNAVDVPLAVRTSDLPKRTASAVVMLAVAGTALALGGWWWIALVVAVAMTVIWEWTSLAFAFAQSLIAKAIWSLAGVAYVGLGAVMLVRLRNPGELLNPYAGIQYVLLVVGTVIAVDIGAYFAGRAIGGPKIAPAISPSKTWAGLFGGIVGAIAAIVIAYTAFGQDWLSVLKVAWIAGIIAAVVAQAGDFFESWMKRKAGVKDSGRLIPGHGGLFDRVDGLLAVLFVGGVLQAYSEGVGF
jgi:phosphatidate cytidylyltransferase